MERGDTVKCIDIGFDNGGLTRNKAYKIISIGKRKVKDRIKIINDMGNTHHYPKELFVKVDEMIKKGDYVECIDVQNFESLTDGKHYKVLEFKNSWVHIIDDSNQEVAYMRQNFKLVEQEWEIVKPFTLIDIYKTGSWTGTCFITQYGKLLEERKSYDIDFKFRSFHQVKESKVLMDNLDWLEQHGFIQKVIKFKPFTLELDIETADQLLELRQRFNVGWGLLKNYTSRYPIPKKSNSNHIFKAINKEMHRIKR